MNKLECAYLIELIRNVLNNKKTEYREDVDYKKLFNIAKMHTLVIYLYYGLKDYNIPVLSDLLKKAYSENIYKTAVQEAEKENIINELEKNGIKYMPLKGSVLKYLYPSVDMRTMCDFDCLFDKAKAKEVKKIMQSLGYDVELFNKSNHDIYIKKPFMNIEMHKELMHDSYKISKYYHTIWDNIKLVDGKQFEYQMSNEDFYIFMIAHLGKHYVSGGAGIRNFIDIYIFNKTYNDLNLKYINEELEKLGLLTFENYAKELSLVWFDNKEGNEIIDQFAKTIFESGIYGTIDQAVLKRVCFNEEELNNLEESKFKYLFRRLFPSFEYMKTTYSKLNKFPILLPWYYLKRILRSKSKFSKAKNEMNSLKNISSKQKQEVEDLHNKLGVKNEL